MQKWVSLRVVAEGSPATSMSNPDFLQKLVPKNSDHPWQKIIGKTKNVNTTYGVIFKERVQNSFFDIPRHG